MRDSLEWCQPFSLATIHLPYFAKRVHVATGRAWLMENTETELRTSSANWAEGRFPEPENEFRIRGGQVQRLVPRKARSVSKSQKIVFATKIHRPRQDSNLESSDPKSDALSIRPQGQARMQ